MLDGTVGCCLFDRSPELELVEPAELVSLVSWSVASGAALNSFERVSRHRIEIVPLALVRFELSEKICRRLLNRRGRKIDREP